MAVTRYRALHGCRLGSPYSSILIKSDHNSLTKELTRALNLVDGVQLNCANRDGHWPKTCPDPVSTDTRPKQSPDAYKAWMKRSFN